MMIKALCLASLLIPGFALTMRNMAVKPKFIPSADLQSKVMEAVKNMHQDERVLAEDDPHFRVTHVVLRNLLSEEFNSGAGCGAEVPEFAKLTMKLSLSKMVSKLCGEESHIALHTMQLMAHPLMEAHNAYFVDGPLTDEKCPDISKFLKEFSFCLHTNLEKEMTISNADFHQEKMELDKKKGLILDKHMSHQVELQEQGAGDLIEATMLMATSDQDAHYGNWCGCNSCAHPEEAMDELPSDATSFGVCMKKGDDAQKAFDKSNLVCKDHGLDAACLRHDYGAGDEKTPMGPLLQCQVNHNFLKDLEAIKDEQVADGGFFDGHKHEAQYISSAKTWVKLQACSMYDESSQSMKTVYPHGDFDRIPEGSCHPDGCYLAPAHSHHKAKSSAPLS